MRILKTKLFKNLIRVMILSLAFFGGLLGVKEITDFSKNTNSNNLVEEKTTYSGVGDTYYLSENGAGSNVGFFLNDSEYCQRFTWAKGDWWSDNSEELTTTNLRNEGQTGNYWPAIRCCDGDCCYDDDGDKTYFYFGDTVNIETIYDDDDDVVDFNYSFNGYYDGNNRVIKLSTSYCSESNNKIYIMGYAENIIFDCSSISGQDALIIDGEFDNCTFINLEYHKYDGVIINEGTVINANSSYNYAIHIVDDCNVKVYGEIYGNSYGIYMESFGKKCSMNVYNTGYIYGWSWAIKCESTYSSASYNIYGGTITGGLYTYYGKFNMSGGNLDFLYNQYSAGNGNATVNITGGFITTITNAAPGLTLNGACDINRINVYEPFTVGSKFATIKDDDPITLYNYMTESESNTINGKIGCYKMATIPSALYHSKIFKLPYSTDSFELVVNDTTEDVYYCERTLLDISFSSNSNSLDSDSLHLYSTFNLNSIIENCGLKIYAKYNNGTVEITNSTGLRLVTADDKTITNFAYYSDIAVDGYCEMYVKYTYQGVVVKKAIYLQKSACSLDYVTVGEITDKEYTGSEINPPVTLTYGDYILQNGQDFEYVYINNVSVGTASILVTGCNNYQNTRTINFNITKADITNGTLSLAQTEFIYSSGIHTPATTVLLNGKVLTLNSDYTAAYTNNVNVGTATVTVTAKGNYTGTLTKDFTIKPFNITTAAITLSKSVYGYLAEECRPIVTLNLLNKSIGADGNFKVTYENNVNVGTATVICEGIGNFTGTKTTSFVIQTVEIQSDKLTDIANLKGLVYQKLEDIEVLENEHGHWEFIDTSFALDKQFDAPGLYSILAEFIPNDTNYLTTSKFATINILRNETTFEAEDLTVTYDYEVVEDIEYVTNAETDPVVKYYDSSNNEINKPTNVGQYTVKFIFSQSNGYEPATFTKNVVIEPKSIETFDVADIADLTHEMVSLTPKTIVTDDTYQLVEDTDYTTVYENNLNVGTVTITITGINNYTGTITKTFEIVERELTLDMLSDIDVQSYTGSEVKPEAYLEYNEKALTINVDYEVTYENNVERSTEAKIVITGIRNFKGTIETNFEISYGIVTASMYPTLSTITTTIYKTLGDLTLPSNEQGEWLFVDPLDTVIDQTSETGLEYDVVFVPNDVNYKNYERKVIIVVNKIIGTLTYEGDTQKVYDGTALDTITAVYVGQSATDLGTGLYTYEYCTESGVPYMKAPTKVGKYKCVITMAGDDAHESLTTTVDYEITAKSIENSSDFAFAYPLTVEYAIEAICPEIIITYLGTKLIEGTDYQKAYRNNIDVTDSAVIVITGLGNFTGELELEFEITQKTITEDMITPITDQLYFETELEPGVIIYHSGYSLRDGFDFETTYYNNVDLGQASIDIVGIGSYKTNGTITIHFNIVQKSLELDWLPALSVIRVNIGTNLDDIVLPSNASGSWKFKQTNIEFTDGDEVGTYYDVEFVPVSSYYRNAESAVKIYVNKNEGSVTLLNDLSKSYDGLAVNYDYETPSTGAATVKFYEGGVLLTEAPSKVGNYQIVIMVDGDSKYKSVQIEQYFSITAKLITSDMILDIEDQTYTGNAIEPQVTVMSGGILLVRGVDYRLYFEDNVSAGTAKAVVGGIGNYSPIKAYKTFNIESLEVGEGGSVESGTKTILVSSIGTQYYTGSALTPAIVVSVKETGDILVNGVDYTITYADNISCGIATATVTMQGEYSGERKVSFAVAARDISEVQASAIEDQKLVKDPVTPNVSLSYLGEALNANIDYVVSYTNNDKQGVGTAIVTGIGNFTGTLEITFNIEKDLAYTISLVDTNDTYTYVTSFDRENQLITYGERVSYNLEDTTYLTGIACKQSLTGFLTQFKNSENIKLYDASGNVVNPLVSVDVATGWVMELVIDGIVYDRVTLVVIGDVQKQGKEITKLALNKVLKDLSTLDDSAFLAIDITLNGELTDDKDAIISSDTYGTIY